MDLTIVNLVIIFFSIFVLFFVATNLASIIIRTFLSSVVSSYDKLLDTLEVDKLKN